METHTSGHILSHPFEAMAAMALALGYDPAYVATHHLFRLLLLFMIVPFCLRIAHKVVHQQQCSQNEKWKPPLDQYTTSIMIK